MDYHQIACALLIVFCGSTLHGTVAFGFSLLTVPLLLTAGFQLPTVLTIVSVCSAVQGGVGSHRLQHAVPWKDVGLSFVLRAITMLLGIWVLRMLIEYPMNRIKFWIGLVTLLLVLLQGLWKPKPRAKLHPAWTFSAFLASGFTTGLCSIGGPPLVLWVMAHDWTAERTRGFLFASFASIIPLQLLVLYLAFGNEVLRGLLLCAILLPAALPGVFLGMSAGERLSKPVLRSLAFLVLAGIAVSAMWPQLVQWMKHS